MLPRNIGSVPPMMIIANSLIPYLFQSIDIHQEKEKIARDNICYCGSLAMC